MRNNIAKKIHKACITACYQCPQYRGEIDVSLHKEGIVAVLSYWLDTSTIGGSLLFESSYYEELPLGVLAILRQAEEKIEMVFLKEFK